mgnify:CR=1 FL=1
MQPSKTARKARSAALQDLGERLLRLPHEQRRRLALPERLDDALDMLGQIHAFEGRRRQSQYVGKLMRHEDNYHTLAGFILHQLDRIPKEADSLEWEGFYFEVVDMDKYRIDRLLVQAPDFNEAESKPTTEKAE